MDKITQIVVQYIENLERIESELSDDVEDFARRAKEAEAEVRRLRGIMERITGETGENPYALAREALEQQ